MEDNGPNSGLNSAADFDTMRTEKQETLLRWIRTHLFPDTNKHPMTSYGLKHLFEEAPGGFYITNGEFKGAALVAGFKPLDPTALNWSYRLRSYEPSSRGVRLTHGPCIYFIYAENAHLIKIGIANDVRKRFQQLQQATGDTLHLLHARPGSREEEAIWHTQCARYRTRGEWFKPNMWLITRLRIEAGQRIFEPHPRLRNFCLDDNPRLPERDRELQP